MEYERNRTRWHHIALFLIYTAGVVYLLLSSNPYLYSHRELRLALAGERVDAVTPVPKGSQERVAGAPTYWQRANPERSGADDGTSVRDKDYISEWQKLVIETEKEQKITGWAADESGVFLTGTHPWAVAVNPEGAVRWRFRFAHSGEGKALLDPVIDESTVYLSNQSGQLAALDKSTGRVIWMIKLASEIVAAPVIVDQHLWLPIRPLESETRRLEEAESANAKPRTKKGTNPANPNQHRLVSVHRGSGELIDYSAAFQINGAAHSTYVSENKQILLTNDNKIYSIAIDDIKKVSTQTLPDPIKGPAIVAEGKTFVSLGSGKIQAWDLNKKGKFEWEIDVNGPLESAPTYLPLYQRLAVLSTDGHLHMIDLKKAELLWRFSLENRNPSREIWATRLKGSLIEKLSMKWERKGWTMWAPCSDNRLCIYNPDKGQLLARIPSSGAVVTPPLFTGKSFYLLTVEKRGEERKYSLSHYLDEDSFKKKAKAAAEAAL